MRGLGPQTHRVAVSLTLAAALLEAAAMPDSVIVGRLHKVEGDVIIIGGGVRITLGPGVTLPQFTVGTSLTVVAIERDGVIYAENVRVTPPGFRGPRASGWGVISGYRWHPLARPAQTCSWRPTTRPRTN